MKKKIVAIIISVILVISIVVFGRVFMVQSIEEKYQTSPVSVAYGDIIALTGWDANTNILAVNESKTIKDITAHFSDNSIKITSIERVFPNKIIIHIKERLPLLAVPIKDMPDYYALADIDFQLNKATDDKHLTKDLIEVSGVSVDGTFNTPVFSAINQILFAFCQEEIVYYALPDIISKISFMEEVFTITTKQGRSMTVAINELSNKPLLTDKVASLLNG